MMLVRLMAAVFVLSLAAPSTDSQGPFEHDRTDEGIDTGAESSTRHFVTPFCGVEQAAPLSGPS